MSKPENNALELLQNIPNLSEMKPSIDLVRSYWTPEEKGEFKRGVVVGIEMEHYEAKNIELECVIMVEQQLDGTLKTIKNGSMVLVESIRKSIESGSVVPLQTPIQVTFLGKKKTANNFKCDTWSICKLV